MSETADAKFCQICGNKFERPKKLGAEQWARRRTCSKACMGKRMRAKVWQRRRLTLPIANPVGPYDIDDVLS